jgi:hypothetical protein
MCPFDLLDALGRIGGEEHTSESDFSHLIDQIFTISLGTSPGR